MIKRNDHRLWLLAAACLSFLAGHGLALCPIRASMSTSGADQAHKALWIHPSLLLRGGSDDYSDDEEDEEDEMDEAQEDEATAVHRERRQQHRQAPQVPGGRQGPIQVDERGRRRAPYIPRPKKKKNPLLQLATTSLNLSKKAALASVQTSGRAAYYLIRPKSIRLQELMGVWRLDQQVGLTQAVANVQLVPLTRRARRDTGSIQGMVLVRESHHRIYKAPFSFFQPTWPLSCRIEFEARAFQPSDDSSQKPALLFYKGYLERKLADTSVIKMTGTLYSIERSKGMFGKDLPVRYKKIGSFVGRKRVVLPEEDEDEYDEEEEEDDELAAEENGPKSKSRPSSNQREQPDEDPDEYDEEL